MTSQKPTEIFLLNQDRMISFVIKWLIDDPLKPILLINQTRKRHLMNVKSLWDTRLHDNTATMTCPRSASISIIHVILLVILLENTGLVFIVMLMTLNYISQQAQMKPLNYLS